MDPAFRIRFFPREDLILLEVIEHNNILLLFISSSEFLAGVLTGGKVRGKGGCEVRWKPRSRRKVVQLWERQMGSREEFHWEINEVLMRRVNVVTVDLFGAFPGVTVADSGGSASRKV